MCKSQNILKILSDDFLQKCDDGGKAFHRNLAAGERDMCITFVFFGVFVENKQSPFLCLVAQLLSGHGTAQFHVDKENRFAHIDFCLISESFFQ